MTNDERKRLNEVRALLERLEQEMDESIQRALGAKPPNMDKLTHASRELGRVIAARKALEAL